MKIVNFTIVAGMAKILNREGLKMFTFLEKLFLESSYNLLAKMTGQYCFRFENLNSYFSSEVKGQKIKNEVILV